VELRKMTDPLAEARGADGVEGDFLTVEQLAELRQVTPAAIRAQLRAGNLGGEQVLQGQRTVWRIPVGAARRYLEKPGGASSAGQEPPASSLASPAPPASPAPTAEVRRPVPATTPEPEPAPPVTGRAGPAAAAPVASGRVEALESEVRRLRRQLAALAEAHRRLLDAVTADLAEDRSR
jgi:hypothetical protein